MEKLFLRHDELLSSVPMSFVRGFMSIVSWNSRLVCIKGPKGVGKSTLLLQRIRQTFPKGDRHVLYCSADTGYFSTHTLLETAESFVSGAADLLGVAFIIGVSRGITVLMRDASVTDTVLHWGEEALEGRGSWLFILLVYLIYLPLSVLIPSSSGLATLSIPLLAPLGSFAGVPGSLIVTAFQSASALVNLITPTAAVLMGALALGRVPYDRWWKFIWKLLLIFLVLTAAFLALSAVL